MTAAQWLSSWQSTLGNPYALVLGALQATLVGAWGVRVFRRAFRPGRAL